MPTYEYLCRACSHTFEIVQRMSDDTLTVCPECGGDLRKVFAPPVITFKGSGFYATDNAKKTKSTSGAETSEKKSSDAKPAESTSAGTAASSAKSSADPPREEKKEGPTG